MITFCGLFFRLLKGAISTDKLQSGFFCVGKVTPVAMPSTHHHHKCLCEMIICATGQKREIVKIFSTQYKYLCKLK
jgi:hypothetical protein